jgi:addiction module HigA family antidote
MRTLKAVTPGELLLEEFLVPMELSQYRLAKEIDVSAQRIGEIVAGKRAITADTDLRLCRFFGLSNGYWLRAQVAHDTEIAAKALAPVLRLLRLGAPIGAQFLLEMGGFAAVALLIGRIDEAAGDGGDGPRIAGHQIALQLASLSFMVPLGLAMAASVRVGWAIGRGDAASAARSVRVALVAGATVMTGFMALFLLLPVYQS